MEWEQFRYFLTLAKLEHVTQAANELAITQSALSRSIARFESEIGVPLFDRRGRSLKLNAYGKRFKLRVESMQNEFEQGKQELQELLDPEKGNVAFGFLHSLSKEQIPQLIASFRVTHPSITFDLEQNASHLLVEQLESGRLDYCLISPNQLATHPQIEFTALFKEDLFVYVPKNHFLAAQQSVTLTDIKDEAIVHLKQDFSLRHFVDDLFNHVGIEPEITFEGAEVDTVAGLVAAGLGISILPDIPYKPANVVQLPLHSLKAQRVIGIASAKGRFLAPSALLFRDFLMKQLKDA
ncbi:LysR family transcriptional regulator [Bacillus sp. JCM 19046]|nr:LysR family transcriptional regulator [Bacillus sp. JCM 19045]GAF19785.1 LysR family transcriptional regulator [Bacillus sp. JCM 19046]